MYNIYNSIYIIYIHIYLLNVIFLFVEWISVLANTPGFNELTYILSTLPPARSGWAFMCLSVSNPQPGAQGPAGYSSHWEGVIWSWARSRGEGRRGGGPRAAWRWSV